MTRSRTTAKQAGTRERVAGIVALKLLRWAGSQAEKRGDTHEMAHCFLGVLAAESKHDEMWPCVNVEVRDVLTDNHVKNGPNATRTRTHLPA